MSCIDIRPSIQGAKKCPELSLQKINMIGIILPTTQNPFRDTLDDTSTLDEFTTNINTEATFVAAKDAASPDTFMLGDRVYITTADGGEQNVVEFDSLDVLKTNGTDNILSFTFVMNDLAIDASTPAEGTLSRQSKDNFAVFSNNQTFNFLLFGAKDPKNNQYPYYFNYDATNDVAGFFEAKLVRITSEIALTDGTIQYTGEIRMPYGWTQTMHKAFISAFDPTTVS